MKRTLIFLIIFFLLSCEVPNNNYNQNTVPHTPISSPDSDLGIDTKVWYETPLLPIKISLSSDGSVSTSISFSKMTFLGKFGVTFSKKLKLKGRPFKTPQVQERYADFSKNYEFENISLSNTPPKYITSSDMVVSIIRDKDDVDIFVIPDGKKLLVISEGTTRTIVGKSNVDIDVRDGKVTEIRFIKEEENIMDYYESNDNLILDDGLLDESIFLDYEEEINIESL
ncbi:MAG: hypothetical protein AAFO82_08455 [Bacteroidota bacterium]